MISKEGVRDRRHWRHPETAKALASALPRRTTTAMPDFGGSSTPEIPARHPLPSMKSQKILANPETFSVAARIIVPNQWLRLSSVVMLLRRSAAAIYEASGCQT